MDILTQFWPQFSVLIILVLFIIKDLVRFKTDSIRASSAIEILKYSTEFSIVILSGLLTASFFNVVYIIWVVISILLLASLFYFSKTFTGVSKTSAEMKDTFTSKVRVWDFVSVILLLCAGFFDGLIAAIWR